MASLWHNVVICFLSVMDDEEEWTALSHEGIYTPGEADVGHCLKLECRAVLPGGEDICTSRIITTEPVLSSELTAIIACY